MIIRKPSIYFKKLKDGRVKCSVCPRRCVLKEGQKGFCQVKMYYKSSLVSINYGLSTHFVVEPIETNGVFHYFPGEKTLAVGTVGCNLHCKYCQAWRYSQLKEPKYEFFRKTSPEQLVSKAKELNIKGISWTFNDPMSWIEFVIDTAKLAKKEGITSIFKSNHFMTIETAKELIKYVDVFSISIKSIEEEFYRKISCGSLKPVLETAKFLHSKNKHIEISNLIVPGLNDSPEQIMKLSLWVKENLGAETPVHFARFHPDYLMRNKKRTPVRTVEMARSIAIGQGLKYAYTGNLICNKGLNTYCPECGRLLIERENGFTVIHNKDKEHCDKCGNRIPIIFVSENTKAYAWKKGIWSIDLHIENKRPARSAIKVFYLKRNKRILEEEINVKANEEIRITVNKKGKENDSIKIVYPKGCKAIVFENLDRAYYAF